MQQTLAGVHWIKETLSRTVRVITNVQITEDLNLEAHILDDQNKKPSNGNVAQGALYKGPGSRLQTLGGLLLAFAIPAIMITYVVVFSPMAPARYYKSVRGIDEFGADLATFLTVLVSSLIISGLLFYSAGAYRKREYQRDE